MSIIGDVCRCSYLESVQLFHIPLVSAVPAVAKTAYKLAPVCAMALVLSACGGGGGSGLTDSPEAVLLKQNNGNGRGKPTTSTTTGTTTGTTTSTITLDPGTTTTTTTTTTGTTTAPITSPEIIQNPYFDAGLQSWSVQDASTMLVPSEIRAGHQALQVGSSASQQLLLGKLEPGKSYTLLVNARTLQAGASEVDVVFYEPVYSSSFRTYKAAVTSTSYSDARVDFTVPVYSGVVNLSLKANGVPFIVDSASLMVRDPIVQTEPIASLANSYVPAGYALAFNDEFNGTELNRNKWFTRYMYDSETLDHLNDELSRYRDNNNHVVANGVLSLTARGPMADGTYDSGMIRSDWTAQYGYYEARVKMPGGKGVWPAFWIDNDVAADGKTGWPPEIDFFEYVYNGTTSLLNMIFMTVHVASGTTVASYTDPTWNDQWNYWTAPFNFNEGWHTIGAEWTPDTVTTYVDGKKIMTRSANWLRPDGLQAGPAHILFNLGIGGSWPGFDIDNSAFPQALEIDWVRAYKKVN
jgi:beta-glucanase (GH16 family)